VLLGSGYVATARVGAGFGAVHAADPTRLFNELYDPDGSHPSAAGTFLAAACMYTAMTGGSPTAIKYVLTSNGVEAVACCRAVGCLSCKVV